MVRTRGEGYRARVRRQILANLGRTEVKPEAGPKKTALMRLIELQKGRLIEDLIAEGEIAKVGKDLGIDESTVSKWRERFGMR